jgi:hypothetical protein
MICRCRRAPHIDRALVGGGMAFRALAIGPAIGAGCGATAACMVAFSFAARILLQSQPLAM